MATTARITDLKCYSSVNPSFGQLSLKRIVKATSSGHPHNPTTFSAVLGESRVSLQFDPASVLSSEVHAAAFFSNRLAENFGLTFLECAPLAAAMARSALHTIRTRGPGLLLLTQIEVVYALRERSPPPPPPPLQAEFLDSGLILDAVAAATPRFTFPARGGGLSEREISSLKRGPFVGAEEEVCSICLDAFRRGSSPVVTTLPPPCSHVFHSGCIAAWLRRNPTCPVCRRTVGL